MIIGALGINHETASVEQREILTGSQILTDIKNKMRTEEYIEEFIILSTCGRFEIYFACRGLDYEQVVECVLTYIASLFSGNRDVLYHKSKEEAVSHLFKVTCGLDSAVLGEDQILGQVKNAVAVASEEGDAGKILNKLFREAISFSKMVRTNLRFSENPLSLSYIAVKRAQEEGYLTAGKKVTMVGLGKMGGLAIKYLLESPVMQIDIAIRSPEKLSDDILNHPKVRIEKFEARYSCISDSDLVICSTGAPHTVVRKSELLEYKRGALWIDLAMPRDIDSTLSTLEQLQIWHVDHLKDISGANLKKRESLSLTIEGMMGEQVNKFVSWVEAIGVDDVIKAWQETISNLTKETMASIKRKNLASDTQKLLKIEQLVTSSLKQMVKHPIENLKNTDDHDKRRAYIKMIKELYRYE